MYSLNVGGIIQESVVDGPGIRFVIFAQGCRHNCPQCFNSELQSFTQNQQFSIDELESQLTNYSHVRGVTFSGGDPFEQADTFEALGKRIKQLGDGNLSIWCYTGYVYEQLLKNSKHYNLLQVIDVLVDGPFIASEKDISLKFRGSRNQRLIDVPTSLRTKTITLYENNTE